ncbi:tetratricopeptide repeat domain 12 [Turdus rufiventris]|nr:tetratricopeptide repeat domain 12 [Turdus rufiventris]
MLRDKDTEADFQRFLRRVDDVTNLLQGLSSPDGAVRDKAIAETEKRLQEQGGSREEEEEEEESRTTLNRTLINTSGSARAEAVDAALKEQGNEAFRAGDFALAIQRYSQGLDRLRDKQELYTNRAQAYLKLHEYEKAISDCEWALKSRQCYEKMLQIDPQKENLFKECVEEARLEEKRLREEQGAERAAQAGSAVASSIQELLQSISSPGQHILYYTGAIRLLAEAVSSEENQRLLLAQPAVSAQLAELLCSGTPQIHRDTLVLISLYSEHERGRRLLLRQDLSRWPQILLAFVKSTDARADSAMNILSDLAGEKRFQAQCRAMFSRDVLPLFTQLLDGCPDASSPGYQQCVFAVLGLMMNLLLESNSTIQDLAVPISGRCLALLSHQDGRIVTRATGVLSRVLPASPSAVEEVLKGGVVKKMLKFLKAGGQLTCSYAIKTLAICTRSSRRAQEELLRRDKRFQVLLRLLEAEDELLVGNAAFCLSQCLLVPGAGSALLGSSVVQLLLRQAGGDAQRSSVQQNSAIALGRLCVAEPRHLQQLRKLNGLAILNSSMKYLHS